MVVNPKHLSLLDLMEYFQGPFSLNQCRFKKNNCPNKAHCGLRRRLVSLENDVARKLRSIALSHLME